MSTAETADVMASLLAAHTPAGWMIYRTGEMPEAMYIIESGVVRLETPEGIGIRGAGEHFGDVALVLDRPHGETAMADTDCRLMKIERSALGQLLKTHDNLGRMLRHASSVETITRKKQ